MTPELPRPNDLDSLLIQARDLKFKFLAQEGLANASLNDKILEFADALFDSAPFMFVSIPGGHIVGISPLTEKLFGYPEGELLGKLITILVPDDSVEKHEIGFVKFCENPISMPIISRIPLKGKMKDGTIFDIKIGLHPTKLLGRDIVVVTILPAN